MKEIKFIRNRNKITNVATGEVEVFPSISKAKKWSRDWQKANGGLGCAGLIVVRG